MDADKLRRWWRDHQEIDRALEETRLDLESPEPTSPRERCSRLAAALERHFATEEEIYFPLAARVSEQSACLLDRARRGHQQLRERLQHLRAFADRGEIASARRTFSILLQLLQAHEEDEVAILVELERLVTAPSLLTAPASSPAALR